MVILIAIGPERSEVTPSHLDKRSLHKIILLPIRTESQWGKSYW